MQNSKRAEKKSTYFKKLEKIHIWGNEIKEDETKEQYFQFYKFMLKIKIDDKLSMYLKPNLKRKY